MNKERLVKVKKQLKDIIEDEVLYIFSSKPDFRNWAHQHILDLKDKYKHMSPSTRCAYILEMSFYSSPEAFGLQTWRLDTIPYVMYVVDSLISLHDLIDWKYILAKVFPEFKNR